MDIPAETTIQASLTTGIAELRQPSLAVQLSIAVLAALSAATLQALEPQPLDLASLGAGAQPNLGVDSARSRFVLSWQAQLPDGCAALNAVEIDPDTAAIGRKREIARGCDWFVNWADIPSLVVTDNGDWLAHWLQRSGSGYAYDIRLSRSSDRGRTWSSPFSPHNDGTPTQHGFVSMAPLAGGDGDRAVLVWLDGRNGAAGGTGHGDHDHDGHESAMSLRSAVIGTNAAVADESEIDARVCSCCPTGLVRMDNGEHLAIYRDRSDADVRDTSLAHRGSNGWQSGLAVHHDGWTIAGCPVNGPALAARGDQVLAAWSTMADGDELSVRYRLLSPATPPQPADAETAFHAVEHGQRVLGRVDVAASADGWLLTWLGAGDSGTTVLRLAYLDETLRERTRLDIATLPRGRDIGLPRLAALGKHVVLAWTELDERTPTEPGQRRATRLRAVLMHLP